MIFTLKVIDDVNAGVLRSDTKHVLGGTDLTQAHAFCHLFPSGFCSRQHCEMLYDMARIHGWDVKVKTIN